MGGGGHEAHTLAVGEERRGEESRERSARGEEGQPARRRCGDRGGWGTKHTP